MSRRLPRDQAADDFAESFSSVIGQQSGSRGQPEKVAPPLANGKRRSLAADIAVVKGWVNRSQQSAAAFVEVAAMSRHH
jgi:hypothetical protein